jgi:hypothetical protein
MEYKRQWYQFRFGNFGRYYNWPTPIILILIIGGGVGYYCNKEFIHQEVHEYIVDLDRTDSLITLYHKENAEKTRIIKEKEDAAKKEADIHAKARKDSLNEIAFAEAQRLREYRLQKNKEDQSLLNTQIINLSRKLTTIDSIKLDSIRTTNDVHWRIRKTASGYTRIDFIPSLSEFHTDCENRSCIKCKCFTGIYSLLAPVTETTIVESYNFYKKNTENPKNFLDYTSKLLHALNSVQKYFISKPSRTIPAKNN